MVSKGVWHNVDQGRTYERYHRSWRRCPARIFRSSKDVDSAATTADAGISCLYSGLECTRTPRKHGSGRQDSLDSEQLQTIWRNDHHRYGQRIWRKIPCAPKRSDGEGSERLQRYVRADRPRRSRSRPQGRLSPRTKSLWRTWHTKTSWFLYTSARGVKWALWKIP